MKKLIMVLCITSTIGVYAQIDDATVLGSIDLGNKEVTGILDIVTGCHHKTAPHPKGFFMVGENVKIDKNNPNKPEIIKPNMPNKVFVDKGCDNSNNYPTNRLEVEALNLDATYPISNAVYQEFLTNLIFENQSLRGAIYAGIESELNDTESDGFWGNFGFSIRNKSGNSHVSHGNGPSNSTNIFEGFKPKRGGCRSNSRWICVIRSHDLSD